MPLLGALPLASAGLAGLGAVALLFDGVHGITVAFGFTLIGVVQDYPIHLFSHQRAGVSPWANARALWPTLATGVASTCIAYVTFLFSGVDGLKQLAVFTIAGLGTAALSDALPAAGADRSGAARLRRFARGWRTPVARASRACRGRASVAGRARAASRSASSRFAPGAFWQNDLSKLTPVPADALARDAQLRDELGAPDVRYVLALRRPRSRGRAAALRERLRPRWIAWRATRALAGYDLRRALPAERRDAARAPGEACRRRDALHAALDAAVAGRSPFRSRCLRALPRRRRSRQARAAADARADLQGTPLAAQRRRPAAASGERPRDRAGVAERLDAIRPRSRSVAQRNGAQLARPEGSFRIAGRRLPRPRAGGAGASPRCC